MAQEPLSPSSFYFSSFFSPAAILHPFMGSGLWWLQRKRASFVSFFGVSPKDAERGLRKIPILFEAGWDSSLFWISTPLSSRHLWVLSIPLNTSVAALALSLTCPGLFLSIPCWITLRALANFSIFTLCSFRSWRTSFHPSAPGGVCECASGAFTSSLLHLLSYLMKSY